mmetsp:Transcript_18439/g.33228  ORF Transcript_18439/g.33228 Transcript_18439/m.33228 type:complete len:259 (+) Transcript_18439:211-987(+)
MDDLKELIIQTLDANGVLDKIRAQLRVSVFKAIDNQQPASLSFEKSKAANAVKSEEGRLCAELLRDFLDFYKLTYTMHVFLPETRLVSDVKGQALAEKCGVQYEQGKPIIYKLLEKIADQQKTTIPVAAKPAEPQEDLNKVTSLKLSSKLAPLPSLSKSNDKPPPPRSKSPPQDPDFDAEIERIIERSREKEQHSNVDEEISEDEEDFDNYEDNLIDLQFGESGGTNSMGQDASVDSLALEDYDHIEDVKRAKGRFKF